MTFDLRSQIRELTEPTVQRLGFDLVAVQWLGGRRPVLRLSIDKLGGVGADDCARLSHQLSPLLDQDDPISEAYRLEVSSPGIERPVQRRDDFRRFTGFRAKLRLSEGWPRRRYSGELGGMEDDEVLISAEGELHRVPFEAVQRAHLVLDLEEYARLAGGLPPLDALEPTDAE